MSTLFRIVDWLFDSALARALYLLTGGSFQQFWRRMGRLRAVAASVVHGGLWPPMPVRLQVETTDLCNLKCRMCAREVIDGMNSRHMGLEPFKKLINQTDPFYVTLNGLGEPLLDNTIFQKLELLHRRGVMTSMPTNGTYIRRGNIEKLVRNLPDVLHFSIDGATKESYEYVRVLGDFEEIVEHYRKLLDLRAHGKTRPGTKIAIQCVLQKANLQDYRDMYRLVQSMPELDSFDLVPIFTYGLEGGKFAYLIPSREEVTDLHRNLDQAIAAAPNEDERAFYRRWKEISGRWLKEAPEPAVSSNHQAVNSHSCMVPWFSSYVDAKGRVYPCCFLTNTEHVMGNIYGSSFADVWHGENYRKFRNNLRHDRKNLHGCATCPQNDDGRLAQLSKLRLVLRDAEPKQPVQPINASAE